MADVIHRLVKDLPSEAKERGELLKAARQLVQTLETAQETQQRIYQNFETSIAQIGVDLGVFRTLDTDRTRIWRLGELAEASGAEKTLLERIFRAFAAYGMLEQVDEDGFRATKITSTLAMRETELGLSFFNAVPIPVIHTLPGFFRSTHYQSTVDANKRSAFKAFHNTDLEPFMLAQDHPDIAQKTLDFMPVQKAGRPNWTDDLVPFHDFELSSVEADRVLFLDIGGGAGHQCIALRHRHPELKGRVVLQDLPHTIGMLNKEPLALHKIEAMGHDMFEPQPIKSAKVYYLRTVFHDWPDEACRQILRQLKEALGQDSVIMIDEMVMPKLGATALAVAYDVVMMACFAATERTAVQWQTLVESVGLRIRDIWTYDEETGGSLIVVDSHVGK